MPLRTMASRAMRTPTARATGRFDQLDRLHRHRLRCEPVERVPAAAHGSVDRPATSGTACPLSLILPPAPRWGLFEQSGRRRAHDMSQHHYARKRANDNQRISEKEDLSDASVTRAATEVSATRRRALAGDVVVEVAQSHSSSSIVRAVVYGLRPGAPCNPGLIIQSVFAAACSVPIIAVTLFGISAVSGSPGVRSAQFNSEK